MLGLFLLILNLEGTGSHLIQEKRVIHNIRLADPVKKDQILSEYSLVELKDNKGEHSQYHLDVASVYCTDSVCKVVPVRIFWDSFGNYQNFELNSKYKLEKDNGKLFSRKDYKKLHVLLQDKNSRFNDFLISEITKTSGGEGVDANSGATTIVLPDSATIKGATLTCYTLWHWVYGGVDSFIRDITGDAMSTEQFVNYLHNEDKDDQYFSLQQIVRRKIYDEKILREVLLLAPRCNDREQILIVEYLEGASANNYFAAIEQILGKLKPTMRIRCLNSLIHSKYIAPNGYYERLSYLLSGFTSFQETDIFLTILEKTNTYTPEVIEQVFGLLSNQNMIVARRSYWFLNDRKLSKSDREKLDEFYKKNSTYL